MNPLQYYRKILVHDDTRNQDNGQPMTTASTRLCLEEAAKDIAYEQKWHPPGQRTLADGRLHGIGIACMNDRHGTSSAGAGVVIYMNNDGTANFVSGMSNNQQGTNSVTQTAIVAEALGLPMKHVTCSSYGTADQAPFGGSQAGSAGNTRLGTASLMAALDVRQQMFNYAATQLGVAPEELHARNGSIFSKTDPTKTITHAVVMAKIAKPIIGVGKSWAPYLRKPFQGGEIGDTAFHRQGSAAAWEVAVDPETGDVEVLKQVFIHDAGRVICWHQSDGQIKSSLWSNVGKAFFWDVHHDPQTGKNLHQTHIDDKSPTCMDADPEVYGGRHVESIDANGAFGMQGLGEPSAVGVGYAALLMAVHNAIGGDFSKFQRPMTPDKILKHLGKA